MPTYTDKKHSPVEPVYRDEYHIRSASSSYSAANSYNRNKVNGSPRTTYMNSNGSAFTNGDGNYVHDTALRDYTPQNAGPPRRVGSIPVNGTACPPQNFSDHHHTSKIAESPLASAQFTSLTLETDSGLHDAASHMMEPISTSPEVASNFSFSTTLRRQTQDSVLHSPRSRQASKDGIIPAGPPDGIVRRVANFLGLERFLDNGSGGYDTIEMGQFAGREGPEPLSSKFAHRTVQVSLYVCVWYDLT